MSTHAYLRAFAIATLLEAAVAALPATQAGAEVKTASGKSYDCSIAGKDLFPPSPKETEYYNAGAVEVTKDAGGST